MSDRWIPPTEDPFMSLAGALVCSSRDHGLDSRDAWVYGIVVGWDAASLRELAAKHGWSPDDVSRLKRLRARYCRASKEARHG